LSNKKNWRRDMKMLTRSTLNIVRPKGFHRWSRLTAKTGRVVQGANMSLDDPRKTGGHGVRNLPMPCPPSRKNKKNRNHL
jgi:hypothetical protein